MAEYKTEKGFAVQTLSSDTAASAAAGGSWASGGNLNTARGQVVGFGTTPAAGAAMGTTGSVVTNYEQYNGTAWTETTDINTAGRNGLGTGTTTAGLVYGGWPRGGATETWNGSAWTEVGDMTRGANASQSQAGGGTQTAAFGAGGEPGTTYFQLVETWDGSSWTEVTELNTGRNAAQGFGITTAGYVASGYSPPIGSPYITGNVEVYNGSSWTETTNVNTNRGQGGGAGNSTSGIIYTGSTGPGGNYTANTESWNGSAWTELNNVSTARASIGKTPNPTSGSTDALAIGGEVPSYVATTEEWTAPSTFTKINLGQVYFNSTSNAFKVTKQLAPTGVWSSGGNVNTARELLGGWGTDNTAAGVAGGNTAPGPSTANTELYNGSAWTEVNDLNAARAGFGATGLYSAGIAVGAYPPAEGSKVELWDGTNWTETTEINTARGFTCLSGVQTACILVGGYSSPPTQRYAICEQWDGSSWTEIADLNTGRPGAGAAAGAPVTDTVAFGGYAGSPLTQQVVTEKWNGSSWTEVGDMNNKKNVVSGHGDSGSNAGAFGGEGPGTHTELWNGSSWTEVADNANPGWRQQGGVPSLTKGILSAGGPPAYAHTEEWNALEENKTITVS
jgi:hypothetical protein